MLLFILIVCSHLFFFHFHFSIFIFIFFFSFVTNSYLVVSIVELTFGYTLIGIKALYGQFALLNPLMHCIQIYTICKCLRQNASVNMKILSSRKKFNFAFESERRRVCVYAWKRKHSPQNALMIIDKLQFSDIEQEMVRSFYKIHELILIQILPIHKKLRQEFNI